jgi:hypothetical protein
LDGPSALRYYNKALMLFDDLALRRPLVVDPLSCGSAARPSRRGVAF